AARADETAGRAARNLEIEVVDGTHCAERLCHAPQPECRSHKGSGGPLYHGATRQRGRVRYRAEADGRRQHIRAVDASPAIWPDRVRSASRRSARLLRRRPVACRAEEDDVGGMLDADGARIATHRHHDPLADDVGTGVTEPRSPEEGE